MTPWPFVTAAYVVTLGGGAVLAVLSYLAMRKAEK
jgi:Na+-transporting methylmalonyl-CoA/oxaloacetate decarboxylase gamma subunit